MTIHSRAGRRGLIRIGGVAAAAAGLHGVGSAWAQARRPVNGMIFCHSMGTAEEIGLFKAATGLDMSVTCWVTNTDTLTKMASGAGRTFDVFNISMQFVPILIQRGLVAPIDSSKVPNTRALAPMFSRPPYSTVDGKQYSVPFMFGYDSVVYNRKKLGEVDSYGILFDEKYRGQIALRDDPQLTIAQTALFLGHANPWRLSTSDLREITRFLIGKKPIFRKLWGGFAEAVSLLRSEEVVAVGDGWISMAWALNGRDGTDFAIANPKEKALVWTHDWLIPREAAARGAEEGVYAFMNWSLSADQAALMGRKVGYVSPSTLGLPLLSAEEARRIGYDSYEAVWRNGMPMSEVPANLQEWVDAWSRFKAA
jgi:spermidine/putrescine-binding protein